MSENFKAPFESGKKERSRNSNVFTEEAAKLWSLMSRHLWAATAQENVHTAQLSHALCAECAVVRITEPWPNLQPNLPFPFDTCLANAAYSIG